MKTTTKRIIIIAILTSILVGGLSFSVLLFVARKYNAERKEKIEYLSGILFLEKIAGIMKEEKKIIPLYDIYKKHVDFFSLSAFTTLYSKENYEALYWGSLKNGQGEGEFIVGKDIFDKICCFVVEYNEQKGEVLIYDKNNHKINIKFKIPN